MKNTSLYFNKQKGMALLEVIVAMLIFALAILPLVRLQVLSMDATKAGYFKTETASAAQSVMDYLASDETPVFSDTWGDIAITAGQDCSGLPEFSKAACDILNSQDSDGNAAHIYARNNAVLCIYRKPPTPTESYRQISIRSIWYIGKREEGDTDLREENCGGGYDQEMQTDIISKENIDHIQINMVY